MKDSLMTDWISVLHSYLAYIVLVLLFLAVANAIMGLIGKRMFTLQKDYRLSLFTLILCHMQLLVGLLLFFISTNGFNAIKTLGMGGLNSAARLLAVEHPLINIIAVALITIGWIRHKKFMEARKKFKVIALLYGLGLLLILTRIPYDQWFN